ncbi:UL16-binding protein 3 [Pteropus alecto]|uniref:UL16-binding protein 3 n=1 Tax=Pteropus alecto TaxID=9402 RepID=UPI0003F125E8|nr:UL16-binding protein 3 [Pteropus alecto]XP_015447853.1 UL16-binding protein 3 [Pteropus alecto]
MAPKLNLLQLLLLLWVCPWARPDAHSLHYDFSISSNRQPRCKVQGQLDGNDFLSYDCDNNVISVNHLREKVNATDFWEEQIGTLKDVGDLLKQELPDIKPEQNTDSVPLTLQVRMMCQREARGRPSGSWEFAFNGQKLLIFDAENTEYTVVHSGGERMKNKWKPNQDVTKAFKTISEGDCSKWLNVLRQEAAERTAETRDPPTTAPATAHSKATTVTSTIWTLLVVLTCCMIGITG